MSDYWFFLSYARRNDISYTLGAEEDKTQKLVRRLYQDLAAEIISRADTGQARAVEQIGFFDQRGIEPGDKWDDEVAGALGSARVMLCLFTRNYFNSKVSGQEFEIFRQRVKEFADGKGIKQPPLIIPVLWHRQDKLPMPLPAVTADLQYTYDEFSKLYAAEGLEFLMRLEKHKDDYEEFLIKLADRVVEVAEKHVMPTLAACPQLKDVENAFQPKPIAVAPAPAPAETILQNSGPGFAHFVFVAGHSQELQGVRLKLNAYGKEGRLWKPYVPHVDKPVGLFTQRAATDVELQHEVLPVSTNLITLLENADDTNTIVVLIVDPWSLNVQLYKEQMKRYDKRNLVSCAVLVVWNEKDQEPGFDKLSQKVKETFQNSLTNNNLYIRDAVVSETQLEKELTAAIVEIRRRLDVRAKLFYPVDAAGYSSIPQVETPAGDTP
jgi:FxsC-like protein